MATGPADWFARFFFYFFFFFKPGSPADKADLEIGDEILEVNGKSLDGATHTEVISHIHQVPIDRWTALPSFFYTGFLFFWAEFWSLSFF